MTGCLPDTDYPVHDKLIVATRCGRICLGRKEINFSTVFACQAVGIKEVHDDIWLLSFMDSGSAGISFPFSLDLTALIDTRQVVE